MLGIPIYAFYENLIADENNLCALLLYTNPTDAVVKTLIEHSNCPRFSTPEIVESRLRLTAAYERKYI